MKISSLWHLVVQLCLARTILAQSAATTSYGLLDVITKAESGLGALMSANAAQSSQDAGKSSIGLGGFVSIAGSGLGALTSANAAQSSQGTSATQTSDSQSSRSTSDASASRTSPTGSGFTNPTSSSDSSSTVRTSSELSQAKPTSPSSTTSSASASSSAAGSGGGGGNSHRTLIIALATVLGLLTIGILIIVLACYLTRRSHHQNRMSRRTLTPESEEVDSWRHHSSQEMQYAQLSPRSPTAAGGLGFVDNGHLPSHPYPVMAPDPRLHPAMRHEEIEHQNPFTPVPPPRRRVAPNARPGLTDASVPGDEPFMGTTVFPRPRSRSMSSSRMRARSTSQPRVRSGIDSTYSSLEPSVSLPNSGLNNHPTSIPTSDLPPAHTGHNIYRDSRPATPMALAGFGPSVGQSGAINPHGGPVAAGGVNRHYAPYHDYDFVPPPSPPQSPARRTAGTPPSVPSRSPKRVSFSNSVSNNGSGSHSNSETASTESEGWRMSQMPGSFNTPRSGPSTPTRSPPSYFPEEQTRHSYDGKAGGNGNGGRRLRLSDLRQQEEREWYQQNHQAGYGVGTAL